MTETKALLNYTTSVPVGRTISEMQKALANAGAKRVMVEFDAEGEEAGIAFSLLTPHGERYYSLPCDTASVHRVLVEQKNAGKFRSGTARADEAQSRRVAWRILKDWLEAQLALVRTRMVGLDQVMLPYLHIDGEKTLYMAWAENEARAIGGGS